VPLVELVPSGILLGCEPGTEDDAEENVADMFTAGAVFIVKRKQNHQ
jgi:hypothetical protein